jgi:hypothetical protein
MNLNIGDLLNQRIGTGEIEQMSRVIDADPQQTSNAVSAALPLILGGLSRNAASGDGASSLLGALDRDHDGSVLDDVMGHLGQGGSVQGDGILSHVFGNGRSVVEQGVSQASGLDMSKVAQLLPLLAPIVMGALGRARRDNQIDEGSLPGVLNEGQQSLGGSAGLMGTLSEMLDQNNDGSVVDDLGGLLGGMLGGKR